MIQIKNLLCLGIGQLGIAWIVFFKSMLVIDAWLWKPLCKNRIFESVDQIGLH